MAIYNGREVQLLAGNPVNHETTDLVTIVYKTGETETVKLGNILFTEDEKKTFIDQKTDNYDFVKTISDKDLKNLQDSQDPEKNEKRMADADKGEKVTIVADNAKVDTKK